MRLTQLVQVIANLDVARTAQESTALTLAMLLQNKVAPYPPATIANSPSNPTGRWYERGYGPRWRLKNGVVHGRQTSQALGRSWFAEPRPGGAVLGNRASYWPYVQDSRRQTKVHAAHGWVTQRDAWNDLVADGTVSRVILAAVQTSLLQATQSSR